MKKRIIFTLVLILGLSSFGSFGGTQKAEAADWVERGSIFTTYYHSGSFSNYVYTREFKVTSHQTILAGISAKSSGSGTFKAILQKKVNGVWQDARTKTANKNGYTSLTFQEVSAVLTYRIKLVNTGGAKVNYTFWVSQ